MFLVHNLCGMEIEIAIFAFFYGFDYLVFGNGVGQVWKLSMVVSEDVWCGGEDTTWDYVLCERVKSEASV